MRLHRFIGEFDLKGQGVEIKNPENIKQIKGVLRLGEGDRLILCDGRGQQGEFRIVQMERGKIVCELVRELPANIPTREVALYLAILKKENFELAVQKAVECGVSVIVPVETSRTVKTGLNEARLRKIILEASEQCGRTDLPHLAEKVGFKEALRLAQDSAEKVIFDGSGEEYRPNPKNNGQSKNATVSIFIGPEGGFAADEVTLAKEHSYTVASLGPLTLRGETAAIVATYRAVNCI